MAAARWNVAHAFTDWKAMLDSGVIDAVIVASPNDSHFTITMAALERRLPVLCEKPIAMNADEAIEMADVVRECPGDHDGAVHVSVDAVEPVREATARRGLCRAAVPPEHALLRGLRRGSDYAWRFDDEKAGAGILGDLGADWLDMARWFLGEITAVSATTSRFVTRGPRPDGTDYPRGEDSVVLMARFESGALAILQTSAVCWEGTSFGQTHLLDLHGSEGTIYATNHWDNVQEVRGVKAGEKGPAHDLDIPDALWAGAPPVLLCTTPTVTSSGARKR